MSDVKSLQDAITQYEVQLTQIQTALSVTVEGPDRENLLTLRSDVKELLELTKQNLMEIKTAEKDQENMSDDSEDPLAKEYAMFKAELKEVNDDSTKTVEEDKAASASIDIEDELKALEGMKCRAPHGSAWCGTGYHNAMVCSAFACNNEEVKDMQDIKVRVFFLNPTHKEMLPCSYFLNGNCKFDEENCNFSHGEVVPLSTLEEYRDPDYENIKMGSRVLAKSKNKLWHRAVVLKVPEVGEDHYRIKFETNGNVTEVELQDLLPLEDADLELSDTSDDSSEEEKSTNFATEDAVQQSLLTEQPHMALGGWEKHTRGIGSKLMAQMGYVSGTGLGKRADGRIEPVEATVLPAGKSLDHCMELRKNAGGDKNLFSVAKKMQKQQQRMEQQRERQYLKEKQREQSNIFNFINATLGDKADDEVTTSNTKNKTDLKTESNRKLNVAQFQVGEDITRLERESTKLKDSLTRHTKGSIPYNNIVIQYNEKQKELANLRSREKNIIAEQNQRRVKAKLTIF